MQIAYVERFCRIGLFALLAPRVIAAKVERDRVKPGREFCTWLKPANAEIEPHECLLQDVPGGFLIAGVAAD